ncbi:MAG: TetR/AcrR family transcriptional regulator [Ilumatobacteraceae bacterium]
MVTPGTPSTLGSRIVDSPRFKSSVLDATHDSAAEIRVLEAARRCVDRWGISKVTIDDVAAEAHVSRATLYRLFPGGKDVLFEALRGRELAEFFEGMRQHLVGVESLVDFAVEVSHYALSEMRNDRHLATMLATEEGAALKSLTVEGLPQILRVASQYIVPLVGQHLAVNDAEVFVEILARLIISNFLAPSIHFDLSDRDSARQVLAPFVAALHLPVPT